VGKWEKNERKQGWIRLRPKEVENLKDDRKRRCFCQGGFRRIAGLGDVGVLDGAADLLFAGGGRFRQGEMVRDGEISRDKRRLLGNQVHRRGQNFFRWW